MSSPHYNHPYWPSPRAARIAKLLLEKHEMPGGLGWIFEQVWRANSQGHPVKPEGRLTHDKALKVMADYLGLTVHEFLHIKPVDAILRLKLANTEEKAWSILGNTTLPVWWGGRMPCCVVCDRILPPAPAAETHVPWQAAPPVATAVPAPAPATVVPVRDPPALSAAPAPPPGYVLWSESDDPCSCRGLGRTCHCFPIMHDGSGRLWFVTGPGEVWPGGPRDSVACRHPPAPAGAASPASGELIETLMEFLKEMNGIVTAGDQRYVTALVQRFKGRVV